MRDCVRFEYQLSDLGSVMDPFLIPFAAFVLQVITKESLLAAQVRVCSAHSILDLYAWETFSRLGQSLC